MIIREYSSTDLPQLLLIWNEIVREGNYFPQDEEMNLEQAARFFAGQTEVFLATEDALLGFYILHPNDIGRKAHIANASYGVAKSARGKGIGRRLVEHSLEQTKKHGFVALQFNAVVSSNTNAISLYEDLGFRHIGTTPKGFRQKDASLADALIYYHEV